MRPACRRARHDTHRDRFARTDQRRQKQPVFHIALDAFVERSRRRDIRSDEELSRALRLHYDNLLATLRRVAASHFDIVLDLVLRDSAVLDECIAALAPRPTFVVSVHCPLDVLEQRERARPDRGMAWLARSSCALLMRGAIR